MEVNLNIKKRMDKETYILDGYKDERGSNVPNYTVSSDKKLDSKGAFFDICEIGDAMKMQPAFNEGLHCHDYYTIFIIKGKGTHQIDMHAEKFSSLSVFFISPGQPHMVKYDELDYGYAIAFSSSFLDNMSANMMFHIKNNVFNTLSGSIVCNINDEKEKFLIEDIKQLLSSFLLPAKSFGYTTRLASLLTVLMVNLQDYGEWHGQIDSSSNANEGSVTNCMGNMTCDRTKITNFGHEK